MNPTDRQSQLARLETEWREAAAAAEVAFNVYLNLSRKHSEAWQRYMRFIQGEHPAPALPEPIEAALGTINE